MKYIISSLLLIIGICTAISIHLYAQMMPSPMLFSATAQPIVISLINLSPGTSFSIPAGAGSTIATISATCSVGSCANATFQLASTASCLGTDNSAFAVSGTNLNIGGTTINDTNNRIVCLEASITGAVSKFQQFTLTGTSSGSIPAAANAGCLVQNGGGPNNGSCFNTLIMNVDFTGATQSFVGTNGNFNASQAPSNWMSGCGGSQPITPYQYGLPNSTPCGDFTITSDGGNSVLNIAYTVNDFNNNVGAGILTIGTPSNPGAFVVPVSWYFEGRVRSDSTSYNNAGPYDIWAMYSGHTTSWTYNGSTATFTEEDMVETLGGPPKVAGIANVVQWNNNCTSFTYACGAGDQAANLTQGSPYDWTQYHTIGMRVTNDGGANYAFCAYVDGTLVENNTGGANCGSAGTAGGFDATGAGDRNGGFILQSGNYFGTYPNNPITGTVNAKFMWARLYSCKNWNTGYTINGNTYTSNGNPCAGALITSNP